MVPAAPIEALVAAAREELAATAQEAVKAAVLDCTRELAAARSLAASWEAECLRRERTARVGRFARALWVLGAFCAGGALEYVREGGGR